MRLIDADALIEDLEAAKANNGMGGIVASALIRYVKRCSTIDAVPVVRCKDCKHYKPGKYFNDINFCHRLPYYAEKGGLNVADADFCSYGERRSE